MRSARSIQLGDSDATPAGALLRRLGTLEGDVARLGREAGTASAVDTTTAGKSLSVRYDIGASRLIVAADGGQRFVRLDSEARGTATIELEAVANGAGNVIVPHGLGRVPTWFAMTGHNGGGGHLFYHVVPLGVLNADATNVQWSAQQMNGIAFGGPWRFSWACA